MSTRPRDFWRRRYGWGCCLGGTYLVVALLSAAAHFADRHEYSIPLFVLVYASYPVYWVLSEPLKPQFVVLERLPQGEAIGLVILVGLTTLLYFGAGQLLSFLVKSVRQQLAPNEARNKKDGQA
jgi:hypothetical protein